MEKGLERDPFLFSVLIDFYFFSIEILYRILFRFQKDEFVQSEITCCLYI